MPITLAQARTALLELCADPTLVASATLQDRCIRKALRRISDDRPLLHVVAVTGDSGSEYAAPTGWETGHSVLLRI